MVLGEISAALVLLLATVVLVENLRGLQDRRPGFDPDGVFQARVAIPPSYRSPEDLSRFYDRLSERLAATPGVEHVGVISVAPLSGLLATVPFSVAGSPLSEHDAPSANLRAISAGYMQTVGTRLLRGRPLAETDRTDTPPVALVSAALADRFLAGDAVGQRLLIDDNNHGLRPVEIVGVVENVRQTALDLPPALDIYLPLPQVHPDDLAEVRDNQFWMVRTRSDPAAMRETFAAHLRAVDPDAAVAGTGPMRQLLEDWLGPRRFHLGLFGAFASTAVLLAVSGLYGLVANAVGQRAPEIGLRMAIGATNVDVLSQFLVESVVLSGIGGLLGIAIGGGGAIAVSHFAHWPVIVSPQAIAVAVLFSCAVGIVFGFYPALRASQLDPIDALRYE
jgi:predicted permease